jgi:hypothetical protein
LACAVVVEGRLELGCDGPLGAEGTGDATVQAGPPEQRANQAEAARPLRREGPRAGPTRRGRKAKPVGLAKPATRAGLVPRFFVRVSQCWRVARGPPACGAKTRWLELPVSTWRTNSAA